MILSQESEVVNFSCCDEACQGNMRRKGKREETESRRKKKMGAGEVGREREQE